MNDPLRRKLVHTAVKKNDTRILIMLLFFFFFWLQKRVTTKYYHKLPNCHRDYTSKNRSSSPYVLSGKDVLKLCSKFTRENPC